MAGIINADILPEQIKEQFGPKLLATPTEQFIFKICANKEMMDEEGSVYRRSRYNPLDAALVPLGNQGIDPPPSTPVRIDIDAEIDYYGDWMIIDRVVTLKNRDDVFNNLVKLLGLGMRRTEDRLTRNMLQATASFINCVGGLNGDNPTNLSASDIDEVTATLDGADAFTTADAIEGDDKFGTAPQSDSYFVMAHTALTPDLRLVDGWTPKIRYPFQDGRVLRSEKGSVNQSRWLLSSAGSITSNGSLMGADVYNCFFAGMESYSCIGQNGYSTDLIYRDPLITGPLARYGTLGYTFAEVPIIDNDAWLINLRCSLNT